jgi:hypothetical protein
MAIRILETNNGGYMIWGGKACAGEKNKKKIDDKEYEHFMGYVCESSEDNSYIVLMADIDLVNAEFNSQQWPVPPGTYSWVSMIMGGPNETDNVVGYEMTTPVVLGDGGTVVLEVSYDLNKMINYYNSEDAPFTVDESNLNENASYV